MQLKDIVRRAHRFADPFKVTRGKSFRLADYDPDDTLHLNSEDKPRAKEMLQIDGILDTETLISFKVFSRHDLERMFSVGME